MSGKTYPVHTLRSMNDFNASTESQGLETRTVAEFDRILANGEVVIAKKILAE